MTGAVERALERVVFGQRAVVLVVFAAITAFMGYQAAHLRVDAGFEKSIPLGHPYMQTFMEYQSEFGGANRILVALSVTEGDIFTKEFFETLQAVTDEIFYIPGVDRPQVTSLVTPNVRFVEIIEDGFAGGNVVPADFRPTPEMLEQVRRNVLKTNEVGRLVANDFTAAIVRAQLLERDPDTGERLDYLEVARRLEQIREKYETDYIRVHIIGFAKLIGDIAEGALGVVFFFGITFLITGALVYAYSRSIGLTVLPLTASVVAVIWQLGLLTLLGFGLDPMSILVPFLVFAIGVSHGVQMINAARARIRAGESSLDAARGGFRQLLTPCSVALASDTVGFLTILLIDIGMIRELAITASLGVAVIVFTNLILLPVLISFLPRRHAPAAPAALRSERLWRGLARVARPRVAGVTVGVAAVLFVLGGLEARNMTVGDMDAGSPELRPESRYNRDAKFITDHFSIGVDVLSVIVETVPGGCTDHEVMSTLDDFEWYVRNVPGVQSAVALSTVAKVVNAGWNEGAIKWRIIPRDSRVLAQAVSGVETSTGLLNDDCSVMPLLVFTEDHRASTLDRVVAAVEAFARENESDKVQIRLASGNAGVMAATNQAVRAAQIPTVAYVYLAIIALCLLTFRSLRGTLYIVIPLALVSTLAYALMALLGIGLKVATLPVVALGVGVGVDYGIYIFARLREHLQAGHDVEEAYFRALGETGTAVIFTGLTLAIGVSTWIFSALKFQADMGILLTFMFLMNMLGAVTLLPALAALAERTGGKGAATRKGPSGGA